MRARGIPLLLAATLCLSCFSTIAPEPGSGTAGNPADDESWIRGKVVNYRGPGDWDNVWNAGVQILWLDATGSQIHEADARTNADGFFASSFTHPRIAQVRIATYKCAYDPNDVGPQFTCCLDPQPCPSGCESPWDDAVTLSIKPGGEVYHELRMYCEPLPLRTPPETDQ